MNLRPLRFSLVIITDILVQQAGDMLMNDTKKLSVDIKKIWRLKALLEFIFFMIATAGLLWWHRLAPEKLQSWILSVALIVLFLGLAGLIFELVLVEYRWNFWTYFNDDRQVELHRGFFFRKQVVIPIARVQNVTLKQGPILRWKNLQKVVIETAAGSSEISGLKKPEADQLKELIMELAREAKNDI